MSAIGKGAVEILKQIAKFRTTGTRSFDSALNQVRVVGGGNGNCVCEMTVTEDHRNGVGTLHGAMIALLVDSVSTWALMTVGDNKPGVSVDLSVAYLKSVAVGEDIIIDAQTLKVGKRLAFLNVDVKSKSDGSLLAQGKHTKFVGS